ncbi:MAG: hypothetical protein ACXAD7_15255, partial [Candidatus Kariarchaeaceae archaeon]
MIFEIQDTGELIEITRSRFAFKEASVYIFISFHQKKCFLWFGKNSGVRKQFIAANEARKIKMDTGYKTSTVQHDDTEDEFKEGLKLWRKDKREKIEPAKILVEQRNRILEVPHELTAKIKKKPKVSEEDITLLP